MRRISLWAMSTLTVLVLLFSYSTSRSATATVATAETRSVSASSRQSTSGTGTGTGTGTTDGTPSASSAGTGSSGSSGSSGSTSSSGTQTYDGDAVSTRYGDVQVRITVTDGRITASETLQVPMNDRHDQMINSQAVPVYDQEAVQQQSAQIDVVSGATVTWEGYTQSLQSAIDQAHLS